MENQSSGDYSSQAGSPASCSSTSSERSQSMGSGLVDGIDNTSLSYLMDDEVRAVLKKVTVNEGVLNKAIQSLGGGEKGLKSLMGYIVLWVKQQKVCKASQQQDAEHPANSSFDFSMSGLGTAMSQQISDGFCPLNGVFQPPATEDPAGMQDMQQVQRFKSRRLMMVESEADGGQKSESGFCPSNFMSIGTNPGECAVFKPDMGSPGMMGPCIPRMNFENVMQPPVGNMQPGLAYSAVNTNARSIEQTPAMTTRAARRNRMARQRQSMMNHQARAANHANSVSVGCGSWNGLLPAGGMKKTGVLPSGAAAPQGGTVNSERKGRNMDSLTFLLQKELRPSDVGNLGRIILPKKEAELHMPFLAMRGGVSIQMEDFDSDVCWNLRYSVTPPPKLRSSPLFISATSSFWPNNKSRMYLLENTGEFIKAHRLVEGDLLILYRSQQGNYVLRGKKKKTQRLEGESVQTKVAYGLAKSLPEVATAPKGEGLLMERLYGGGPGEKSVKEEPSTIEDDPFLKDMMMSMGSSFESEGGSLQPLERFPSLNLDFPLDEIMAVAPKAEPED